MALGAYYYASPYIILHRIQTAAQSGQGDRLAQYVDFPAVRESIKSQLQVKLMDTMKKGTDGNPFAALGMALAGSMVGTMVDNLVTPESIATMVNRAKPRDRLAGNAASGPTDTAPPVAVDAKRPRVVQHYEGLDVFQVELHDPNTDELGLTLVLGRDGWFGWKLRSIRLPALG